MSAKNIHIMLDAGHGWNTEGKRSNDGTLRENEFNESVLAKIALLLQINGISYTILAPEFQDIDLTTRCKREYKAHYEAMREGKDSYLISIHANWASDRRANGIETFCVSEDGEEFGRKIQNALVSATKLRDRGVTRCGTNGYPNFYILKNSGSTAILIECGFMSNEQELELLKSDEYRNNIALAIVSVLEKM